MYTETRRILIAFGFLIAMLSSLFLVSKALRLMRHAPVTWEWCSAVPLTESDLTNKHTSSAKSNGFQRIIDQMQQKAPGVDRADTLESYLARLPVSVYVDKMALEEEDVAPDMPIDTAPFPGQSIQSYLNMILEPLNLTWVPKVDHIVVCNRKYSSSVVCLYDVTGVPASFDVLSKGTWRSAAPSYTSLLRSIENCIDQDSWSNAGGTSTMSMWYVRDRNILVISAPAETHLKIQEFFTSYDRLRFAQ